MQNIRPFSPCAVPSAACRLAALLCLASALFSTTAVAADTTATAQWQRWTNAAKTASDAARGRDFFRNQHGGEWSCASCHGANPTMQGRHAGTGKPIAALAPAFNPERFTDSAKADKWFRRNCKDVLERECTAQEKADVLAWLLSLQP